MSCRIPLLQLKLLLAALGCSVLLFIIVLEQLGFNCQTLEARVRSAIAQAL